MSGAPSTATTCGSRPRNDAAMHVLDVPKSTATRSVIHTPGNHRGPRPDGRGSAGEVRPSYRRTGQTVVRDHTIDGIAAPAPTCQPSARPEGDITSPAESTRPG